MRDKFLSIVIPYYDETMQEITPLLSSLNNQVGVDYSEIEVVMVNDGMENTAPEELAHVLHNLDIRIIQMKENRGPGVARQVGMDLAKGRYVMFCDADDTLHSVAVLGAFLEELKTSQPDILASPWLEELRDPEGRFVYHNHEDEATWMHGKAFRLSYLRTNNIRFHEELRVHEDSYFLSLAFDLTENRRKLTFPTYVWKWREDSIVRSNGSSYTYDSMPVFNQSVCLAIGEMERRELGKKITYKVTQLICYIYCSIQQEHWKRPEVKAQRIAAEQSLVKEIAPYLKYFHEAPKELLIETYNTERAKHVRDSIEDELFCDWLKRIGLTA